MDLESQIFIDFGPNSIYIITWLTQRSLLRPAAVWRSGSPPRITETPGSNPGMFVKSRMCHVGWVWQHYQEELNQFSFPKRRNHHSNSIVTLTVEATINTINKKVYTEGETLEIYLFPKLFDLFSLFIFNGALEIRKYYCLFQSIQGVFKWI